ncbi:MAG TPA: 4-(cytidine 5'-diphospho)-2-C-methyl-D-erythritol kinase, partial [Chitinophagaceae bacterium]|nr:4-(cytidine 5'-diphospho)-2-C-methyl-D-erythritol kinase [Chitinophagaceae bacterium]
ESRNAKTAVHLSTSGEPVEGRPANNLCVRAYRLLQKDFPSLPPTLIHLHKVIPAGAGLGGGSANASFTLQMINEIAGLGLNQQQLLHYAAQLGSDCPFFIINKPCYATGRGEILEEFELDLSTYSIVLVNPGIHVNTGVAFTGIVPAMPAYSIKEILQQPVSQWKYKLQNDFEKTVFKTYREIVDIKDSLYQQGALYASMSGSGSSVYGIFEKDKVPVTSFPADYFVKILPGK